MDGGANRRWGRHQRPIIAGGGHAAENKAEVSRRKEGEEISRRRIVFNPLLQRDVIQCLFSQNWRNGFFVENSGDDVKLWANVIGRSGINDVEMLYVFSL